MYIKCQYFLIEYKLQMAAKVIKLKLSLDYAHATYFKRRQLNQLHSKTATKVYTGVVYKRN